MGQKTLIFIEDNDDHAEIFTSMLNMEGVNNPVVRFDNGKAVVRYLKKNWSNRQNDILMLLDLNIPGLNGVEILKQIRDTDELRGLPVVILSSADVGMDIDMARKMGVLDTISKTINMTLFVRKIRNLLNDPVQEGRNEY